MFKIRGKTHQHCDGLARREFLQVGALGFGGLTLAHLLQAEAGGASAKRPKSVIYIVLNGISHIDSLQA
jgi:hypothetical protein